MATATRNDRDGRILPATHWASLVVFAILVPALVILWGMPDRTADAWAWTIKPDLTPIFLGAGYGAGAYFFLRTFLSKQFHPSAAGIFGAGFFATLMLIATLLHWDRFNHGDAPLVGATVFYGWVGVYIVSPFVVLAFSAAMGLLWLSTVPLTSGLVAVMFGTRHVGMLFGFVFLSHQIGAFIGVWLGGASLLRELLR